MDNPNLPALRAKALSLPLEPGVYIMKDSGGKIIYIGKAKVLKNRVSSYFRSVEKHTPKVYQMVQNVRDFEYIVAGTEFEALILECSLIKQHRPHYNILLKDDKGYSYVRVEKGPYGRISCALQRTEDDALYLGPYISSYVVNQTVDEVNKVFQLPTCSRKFPQELGKGRPCLNFHIKQCMGVCRGKISPSQYQEVLDEAVEFIKGGGTQSIKLLTQRMHAAADRLDFEKAALLRDRINAIRRISEQQNVVYQRYDSLDVVAIVRSGEKSAAAVLRFREGRLVDKEEHPLGGISTPEEAMAEFLSRYYYTREDLPKKIFVDIDFADRPLLEEMLTQQGGRKVEITVPERGDGVRLVEMARNNAAQVMARTERRSGRELSALEELGRMLGLPAPPAYIEAYDISNIGGETIVGGMVVFADGRPLPGAYKKFVMKTVVGAPDDYASMAEMVRRRLLRYEEHKDKGVGFGRLPDLILLDGGKGQVAAVEPVIRQLGFAIPVFGMVKDDRHRTRAITAQGGELSISSVRSVFALVSAIQEEVHRFSITFSRQRHQKNAFQLRLEEAPGIGPARARALYKRFRSWKALCAATVEELAQTEGVPAGAAESLWKFLHQEESRG